MANIVLGDILSSTEILLDEDDMASDSATQGATQQSLKAYADTKAGPFFRSQFNYSDADQITCETAQYMCKDKYCYWVSTLTTAATGAAGGIDWWYLYLDYSAITSSVAITATELIWSTTEPTFNTTYRQWMNGDDRCIFAVRTDGSSNILEFFHEGNLCLFAVEILVTNGVQPGTTWTDSTQVIPKFSQRADTTFWCVYVENNLLYIRVNGQTEAGGQRVIAIVATNTQPMSTVPAITDSDGILEFKYNAAGTSYVYIYTRGWYFPRGM